MLQRAAAPVVARRVQCEESRGILPCPCGIELHDIVAAKTRAREQEIMYEMRLPRYNEARLDALDGC